jgi:tRNA modification GTPase
MEDPICALATPWGISAIAVIRTSGEGSIERLAELFSYPEKLRKVRGGRILHGFLRNTDSGEPLDEVMLAVFRSPHSYTGEDSVEIYCHGSLPGIHNILEELRKIGFRSAEPGEFTYRAFMHGKMDLTRAEAVHEIVTSRTRKAHLLALHRLEGSLETLIRETQDVLLDVQTLIEVQLDYPEEEAPSVPLPLEKIQKAKETVERLLLTYREGKLYQEGVRVALAGRTNAGKSSLFNLFLREERSIVSEIHGTTRDYIEATVSIGGIPVRLYDTAGLRGSTDPIEAEGVLRSQNLIQSCPLVLYLIDCTDPTIREEEKEFFEGIENRIIRVYTKIDLCKGKLLPSEGIGISALTGEGFTQLVQEIETRLKDGVSRGDEEVIIESDRQRELLEQCKDALERFQKGVKENLPLDLLSNDMQEAIRTLGEITGEVTTEEMLSRMFSHFCVGK